LERGAAEQRALCGRSALLTQRRQLGVGGLAGEVLGYQGVQLVEPEQRHLRQQPALARHRVLHHHIEGREAVAGAVTKLSVRCVGSGLTGGLAATKSG
jgi:hypothetical protein